MNFPEFRQIKGEEKIRDIISVASSSSDNKRLNVKQYTKYLDESCKDMYSWYGLFDRDGNCLSLSVLEEKCPKDGIVYAAEIQSFVKGYGSKLIDSLLERFDSIWWAADHLGGESLRNYYRKFKGLAEIPFEQTVFSEGKPHSFFYKAKDSNDKSEILNMIFGTFSFKYLERIPYICCNLY